MKNKIVLLILSLCMSATAESFTNKTKDGQIVIVTISKPATKSTPILPPLPPGMKAKSISPPALPIVKRIALTANIAIVKKPSKPHPPAGKGVMAKLVKPSQGAFKTASVTSTNSLAPTFISYENDVVNSFGDIVDIVYINVIQRMNLGVRFEWTDDFVNWYFINSLPAYPEDQPVWIGVEISPSSLINPTNAFFRVIEF